MLLILSARTVSEDIAGQFGRLPPSFLPLGPRRLFAVQAEAALGERCAMTLPADFEIPAVDRAALEAAGIEILPQPQALSLTAAIADAIARLGPEGPLRILYGDTLVRMPAETLRRPDMVAVQDTTANFPWAFVEPGPEGGRKFSDAPPERLDSRRVVCGCYNFADPALLAEACQAPGIVEALNRYDAERPLSCELAKLSHSILGQYDRILLGRSVLHEAPTGADGVRRWRLEVDALPRQARLEELFVQFVDETCGVDPEELTALTALLFLSMLPLHSDRPDLQRHFLAAGLRLAGRVEGIAEETAP